VREREGSGSGSGSVTAGEVIGKIVICEVSKTTFLILNIVYQVLFIDIYTKTLFMESIVVSNLNHPSINLQLNPV
jgi:hypothetical protein